MRTLEIRPATPADLPAVHAADERAFGEHKSPEVRGALERLVPAEAFLLGLDGTEVVGLTATLPLTMTLPGGRQQPVPGITAVSVAATHRRRGVLRELFTAQHHALLDSGAPLAGLTASEATIYGRFGYGPATSTQHVAVDRRRAVLRPTAPDPGGVRQVGPEEAGRLLPALHRRWQQATPGAVARDDRWWDVVLADLPERRHGGSALFFLVHPDGFATYRVHRDDAGRRVDVAELVAATPSAHAALWRVLLGLDLVHTVTADLAPEDPLPFLVTDHRAVAVTGTRDGLWLRLLDVPGALTARSWAAPVDVVLGVADGFLDRGGAFTLRGGPDGVECAQTSREPDVVLDVATLGSAYLGGHRLDTLARAGLVTGDPGAVGRLDRALRPERVPELGTDF